jgi:sugar phosphate isomerase/epimerase
MNAASEPKTGQEASPLFAELGFDYIELPLAQVMEHSDEAFRNLCNTIKAEGIPLEACNNFFPASIRLTGENAVLANALEYAKSAAERAAKMGAKIIVLGSAGAKNIPTGFPYEKACDQFKELLIKLQDIVQRYDITIVLENLNKTESNFVNTVGEGLNFVNEVSLPNIKVLADYYHMRMENENFEVIKKAGNDLRHLHIASKEGRLFPKETDGEDYKHFFALLKSINYNGRISAEAYSKNLAIDGAASLKLLRSLAKSLN